ncbi:MAG: hypothetical protein WC887_03220 [Candidatus Paceibacterota bacterium]|jgi:hypothetical protein
MTKIFIIVRSFISCYSLWILIVLALVLLALAFEGGRYTVYRAHPELSGVEQANAVLQKVGVLIQLPTGETPTMATINDAESAKQAQPFLSGALNGDILIVYPNAAEAPLYRPSSNKLIAVGPVNNTSGAQDVSLPVSESTTASSTNDATTKK